MREFVVRFNVARQVDPQADGINRNLVTCILKTSSINEAEDLAIKMAAWVAQDNSMDDEDIEVCISPLEDYLNGLRHNTAIYASQAS